MYINSFVSSSRPETCRRAFIYIYIYIHIYIYTHTHRHTEANRIFNNTADSLIQPVFISFFYNPAFLLIPNRVSPILGAFAKLCKAIMIFAVSLSLSVCPFLSLSLSSLPYGEFGFNGRIFVRFCFGHLH